ncbi:hypothetical protein [Bacillus coahuilensis]|nr:hypothetical protein [Bacillus coahuilensis]
MKKTMYSLVTAAAIAGTFTLGSTASASEVTVKKVTHYGILQKRIILL